MLVQDHACFERTAKSRSTAIKIWNMTRIHNYPYYLTLLYKIAAKAIRLNHRNKSYNSYKRGDKIMLCV